jgi:mRNA-degrading endonuclease YafQ of YafQ-DinJ toxin-antitoxin module
MPEVKFFRSEAYKETYLNKIRPHNGLKTKFRSFMDLKRQDPKAPFGNDDYAFTSNAPIGNAVPGLRHAHINRDISIIYRVDNNNVYLYGFYRHDDIGTGTPAKKNLQQTAATKFQSTTFS